MPRELAPLDSGLVVPTACVLCPNCGGCANDVCGNKRHSRKKMKELSDDGEGDFCFCV